jgi:predicted O-methyltransferase YrrM
MNIQFWLRRPHLIIPRLRFWLYERSNSDKPWLCAGTIVFLERVLTTEMIGAEFGSGRSTRWLAARLKKLVSIEQSSEWYQIVCNQLKDAAIQNVDYRLIPIEHPESEPEHEEYETLPKYVAVLNTFENDSIDFVLVDGHYRSTCIKAALSKIRNGGYLVVDDTNLWKAIGGPPVPKEWKCVDTSTNGIKTASIWQKP